MKQKSTIVCTLLLLFISLGMNAQNTLIVKEKAGTTTTFSFATLSKVTFNANNMVVTKKNAVESLFSYSNVQKMYFGNDLSALESISENPRNAVLLFPNPVNDQLNIRCESIFDQIVKVKIFNAVGSIILQQNLDNNNSASINVSHLHQGLYFCQVNTEHKLSTIQFIKN